MDDSVLDGLLLYLSVNPCDQPAHSSHLWVGSGREIQFNGLSMCYRVSILLVRPAKTCAHAFVALIDAYLAKRLETFQH